MEQKNTHRETKEALEEYPETNETIICPSCNKEQEKIVTVLICEANDVVWYKCSQQKKCPLFQNKNK
jgi:hypothetical protein